MARDEGLPLDGLPGLLVGGAHGGEVDAQGLEALRDGAGDGLFAFDGALLARRYAYNFRTKSDESSAKDEPLPSRDRYCAAQHCFSGCAGDADPQACKDDCQRLCLNEQCGSLGDGNLLGGPPGGSLFATCALGGCHGPQTNDDGLAMGLDLSTVSALSSSAIGKTAHQTQTGEAATIGQVSGKRFGRAMAVIEPYNPGGSYLMYKLLVASRNHADDIDPSLEAEIARLRAGVVVGLPMPPPTYGATTSAEPGQLQKRMQLISDWIAHGATTDCGPASEP